MPAAEAGAEGSLIPPAACCTVAPDEWPDKGCVVRASWLGFWKEPAVCSSLRWEQGLSLLLAEHQGFVAKPRQEAVTMRAGFRIHSDIVTDEES